MSSETYRLMYFNITAKAELIRYILKYCGLDFVDDRSPSDGNWGEIKPTTPFGQVPVLFIDDKPLSGSQAIARYLAEKHGLGGSNAFENAKLHSFLDAADDVTTWLARIKYSDEAARDNVIQNTLKGLPIRLQKFEDCIGPEGFIFGNKLTYVDFAVHVMVNNLNISGCFPDLMSSYPKLTKLRNDVAKLPAIEKWMKERPSCTYYKIK